MANALLNLDFSTWPIGTRGAIVVAAMAAALVAHQVFRLRETYSVSAHVFTLVVPPVLVATSAQLLSPPHPTAKEHPVALSFIVYLSTLILSIVAYRLSPMHPLARFPGPVWRRVSQFGSACLSITGRRHEMIFALHQRYGDVVRIGPNELSICDASTIPALLGPSGVGKGPNFVGGSLSLDRIPMVGIEDTAIHLQRRRAWNRGLAQSALKQYEPLVSSRAHQLVRRMEAHLDSEVDLGKWMSYYAFDFMSDMAFGGGSELLRDGDKSNIWSVLEKGMIVATFLSNVPWLGIYAGWIPGAAGPLEQLHQHGIKLAKQRLQRGSSVADLFHYLSNEDLSDKSSKVPEADLINDGILAVVAGSDTASLNMTSVFYCLLAHPATYAALQDEVDRVYASTESPFGSKHHREMPYLHAVINEALRLFPPVLSGTQRKVKANEQPVVVGSLCIPPGTAFFMHTWTLHRDPRNFTFPDAFWPERWLIASGQLRFEDAPPPSGVVATHGLKFVHNEIAFTPFSYGPMNCPGKGLAMMEMRVVVSALLQHFRFELREGWDPEEFKREFKDYFTAARPKLPVVVRTRCS